MIKTYRVRFFRVAVYDRDGERLDIAASGTAVANALTSANPLPQICLIPGYDHQARDIVRVAQDRFEGSFAKLRPDAPHIVRGNTEQRIQLLPGDKVVDKSYLIFFPRVSMLVFQINRDGGSITRFFEYLNRLLPDGYLAIREDIIQPGALDRLQEHDVKWFDVAFVRPRNVANANPHDWTSRTISGLGGLNAGRVRLRVSAPRGDDLGGGIVDFLQGLFRFGEPVGLRAKLEDIESPIDLLAEVVQGDIHVTLHNGYPQPAAVLQAMIDCYAQQRDRLQAVFGNVERLP